ncbi:MAG: hypothetical protein GC200_04940 [Tepidisphaera sp.]|nr:hypothetical protein [Tepidisphaera sp.]
MNTTRHADEPAATRPEHTSKDSADPASGARRVGHVDGDRACHACGFNLRGQVVVREPHYQMIMVQCPECGTPSPLLEYPRVGSWITRLHIFLLMLLFSLLIAGFIFTGFLAWRSSYQSMSAVVEPLANLIANDYIEYAKPRAATAGTNAWWGQQAPSPWTVVELPWWDKYKHTQSGQPQRSLLQPLGSRAFASWLNECLVLLPLCALIACALPSWKRRRLLLVPLIGMLVAITLAVSWKYYVFGPRVGYLDATAAALEIAPWWVIALPLTVSGVIMLLGTLLGRPAGRRLVTFLLPPRQWASFGFLWAADGLDLPRA